jgi:HK97 family phage prohead protease
MEHLLLKAATTATDEGTFTAVISTASVDRDKDIIEPSAMVASLAKWAAIGKLVPLAWNHTDEVIGHIDPATAVVKDGEVIANGWVDQSIPRGEEAWRLVKSGTLSFSFGFLFEPKTGATKLPNGRYRVKELDIYEISTIPVGPANNDTRVLSFKAMTTGQMAERMGAMADEMASDSPPASKEMAARMRTMATEMAGAGKSAAEALEEQAKRVAREVEQSLMPVVAEQPKAPEVDQAKELQEHKSQLAQMREELDALKKKAEEADKEPPGARSVDPLRKQAEAVALEFASDGQNLRKPPRTVEQPKPEPQLSVAELKQRMRDELLTHLSGGPTVNRYEKQKLAVEKAMSEHVKPPTRRSTRRPTTRTAIRPMRSASSRVAPEGARGAQEGARGGRGEHQDPRPRRRARPRARPGRQPDDERQVGAAGPCLPERAEDASASSSCPPRATRTRSTRTGSRAAGSGRASRPARSAWSRRARSWRAPAAAAARSPRPSRRSSRVSSTSCSSGSPSLT